ncbi:nucleotidyltransferase domain-containing protein [candidate division KSB1 bacterium]|nr:nucleotidyltransferase domain-containing protein [candidate division KSB1 bacterium]MCH8019454.1 nucleotidyltransferase domain-containing protein [candidate division KSB1 bacterium]
MENIVSKVKRNRAAEEKQVIDEFVTRVREMLDERAKRIVFYGSRARGDADEESDYDFLVLVEPFHKKDKKIVRDISTDISYDNDCYISTRTIIASEFTEDRFFYFYENVTKEGIDL